MPAMSGPAPEARWRLAIWEGRPDAVMTGREELGFPKLFADIPDEPTTCHVVNGIADLDILEYVSAEMIEFSGPGNTVATNGHRVIEPA